MQEQLVVGVFHLVVSSVSVVIVTGGILWLGLDRTKKDLKEEVEKVREDLKEDIGGLRAEMSDMRKEITDMDGRLGRVEGYLEAVNTGSG